MATAFSPLYPAACGFTFSTMQPFRHEAEIDAAQIRQRSQEQSGAHDQHERHRDLSHDQERADDWIRPIA